MHDGGEMDVRACYTAISVCLSSLSLSLPCLAFFFCSYLLLVCEIYLVLKYNNYFRLRSNVDENIFIIKGDWSKHEDMYSIIIASEIMAEAEEELLNKFYQHIC